MEHVVQNEDCELYEFGGDFEGVLPGTEVVDDGSTVLKQVLKRVTALPGGAVSEEGLGQIKPTDEHKKRFWSTR